jgi:hypothetical protein
MNKLLIKFILMPLIYIYLAGLMVSGLYFNWQYARENGFFKWILLGEIVPTLQSTIWPYYAVKHFLPHDSNELTAKKKQQAMQLPPDGQVIAAFKEKAWWLPEYHRLNAALDKAGGSLSASYRVGPKGASYVKVQLERGPRKGLTLIIDLPPEAIVSVDPNTGKTEPGKERTIWTYRDYDLDGIPDEVFSKSFQKPISKESFTNDGFMVVRDSADHTSIFIQWTIALGFSTNHFLYGKDSVSP